MTTASSRSKYLGAILATTMTLQSSMVAFAAGSDTTTSTNVPKQLAYALAPETSRFSALEEAVGIREVPEAVELASKAPMFASKEPSDDDVFSTKLESGSGHFIDLSELAAGNMPPSNNILERMDLIAAATPIQTSAPVVLNATITNDPAVAKSRVDDLTRQILLKIVELERFNLHYKQEVAKQGRWKGWRYGGLQEVNGALNLAGGIVSTGERGSHLRKQGKHVAGAIHTSVQQNANILGLVGSSIGALAALNELGVNEYHDLQARHHGFGPGAARAKVDGLRSDIDRLLAKELPTLT